MATKKSKPAPAKKAAPKLKPWHYLLLVIIPAIVYGRLIGFDFVMHDDDKMILENPLIGEGIDPGIAFTTDAWFMEARIELYRPLQSITYMMDYAIGKEDPTVYHVHNLLIFLLGVVLLFYFLKFYFKPILAWAGTLLYSLNLLTPHMVGWIAARGDLYLMVFGLLFLILLQRYLKTGSASSLWISVPVFFLALLSKESAVALLPVGLIMIYAENRKIPGLIWICLGANLALFAGYYALRTKAIADAGNLSVVAFGQNVRSLAEEFFKMIFPFGFSVMPGYSIIWTIAGFVLLGVLGYAVWKYKPDARILWTGAALWLALLLPSLAYEPSFAGVAYDYLDHRTWLPNVGLWMIVLGILDRIKFTSHRAAPVVFGSVLLLWAGVNVWRSTAYKDWTHYYNNAIKTNPGSGLANLNYGSLLRDQGDWEGALPYMEKGVQLSPDYIDAKIRLSEAYFNLKRFDDAIAISNQALAIDPKNVAALQFRGSAYGASGNTQAATNDFKTVLQVEPENPHGLFNLGVVYKEANLLNEAVETFTKLITLKPDFPNAFYERGFCFGRMGLFPQAQADMKKSIEYKPDHAASYFFRGRTYEEMGNMAAACADYRKAFELGTKEAEAFIQTKCN